MLKLLGKIGEGAYGEIYKASDDNAIYAVKRNLIDSDSSFTYTIRELDLLRRLDHPCIVKLINASIGAPFPEKLGPLPSKTKEDKLFLTFEYVEQDLITYLDTEPPYDKIKWIMVQLLLGVEYLHNSGIIHRDLKPSNLLIRDGPRPEVKIADFGLAEPYTKQGNQLPHVITGWYRPPEVCLKWSNYDYKVDIWSVGCVFFELVIGEPFHDSEEDVDILETIFNTMAGVSPNTIEELGNLPNLQSKYLLKPYKAKKPNNFSWREMLALSKKKVAEFDKSPGDYFEFLDLLRNLLKINPKNRYTATKALNHKFFRSYKGYIDKIRHTYKPISLKREIIRSHHPEMKHAIEVGFDYFKDRRLHFWFTNRILFQALDIYDRYLSTNPKDNTILNFMVCLYMSIKYFSVIFICPAFREVVSSKIKVDEQVMIKAEKFEDHLLNNVLNKEIYRPTEYENSEKILTGIEVEKLIRSLC